MAKANIALIGGRGAGKSKVSRRLGKLSGRPVFSTDTLISFRAGGRSIARIVAEEGWQGFRDREFAILEEFAEMRDVVIDCGGGVIVEAPDAEHPEERLSTRKVQLLKRIAEVVYVERPMSWLLDKARRDSNRPDLSDDYRLTLERRLPWYREVADYVLQLGLGSATSGAEYLIQRYGNLSEG